MDSCSALAFPPAFQAEIRHGPGVNKPCVLSAIICKMQDECSAQVRSRPLRPKDFAAMPEPCAQNELCVSLCCLALTQDAPVPVGGMIVSNFAFLNEQFPALANLGTLAENYLYSDSNSCLIKLGIMGETIVNQCYEFDNLSIPPGASAMDRIEGLYREGQILDPIRRILHLLRKRRNEAVHDGYESVSEGKKLLSMAHGLCQWFAETYGSWQHELTLVPFVMPPEAQKPDASEQRAREGREAELLREDEKKAREAEPVSSDVRRERSAKAEEHRIPSEAETRYIIDQQLRQAGWAADTENLRYSNGTRPEAGRNIAIAEWPTKDSSGKDGRADYALFAGTQLVGIVEAKAIHKDVSSVIDYQCKEYARGIREEDSDYQIGTWGDYKVPFVFAANGRPYLQQYETKSGIWFADLRKPENVPRALHGWMSPEGLLRQLETSIPARNRDLSQLSYESLRDPDGLGLRDYQIRAIKAAEDAVVSGKNSVLLAMATGTGKTRTVLGMMYRFLRSNRFRRILFLVDRTALGQQAMDVFQEVRLEELMTLDELYSINGLDKTVIEPETRVQIATVQGMIQRILYSDDEKMPSVSDFDLVIVDEAHRGYLPDREMTDLEMLYRDQREYQSKYRAVIDYFDATKIALTATPALQTTRIFGEPAFTYSYRDAVIDGYLVDHDAPHILGTKLSTEGIRYTKGDEVTRYEKRTGTTTSSALLADELSFDISSFNRQVITEPFNRAVLEEIAKDLDPGHPEAHGKTLIYAVNDQHADLIVSILKELFAERGISSDSVMKITGAAGGGNPRKVQEAIARFKNERYPSVAVTVDLLTTGIDVPEITTLVFMRRVKSRILYEQMLGRATRLCPEIGKTHFEIYDAVGVYESLEAFTTMKPVAVHPSATYADMLAGLKVLEDEDAVASLIDQIIAKVQRQKQVLDEESVERVADLTDRRTLDDLIADLRAMSGNGAKTHILEHAELFAMLEQQSKCYLPQWVVVSDEPDELIQHFRGYAKGDSPGDYLEAFAEFVKTNRNEISALNIICTRPQDLTTRSLHSLMKKLDSEGFSTTRLNKAIAQQTDAEIGADIISLIRRYALGSPLVPHEERIRSAVDRLREAHSFSAQERMWIERMEKYLLEENILNARVFDEDPRFKGEGGFARIDKVFDGKLGNIVGELNRYLYDEKEVS